MGIFKHIIDSWKNKGIHHVPIEQWDDVTYAELTDEEKAEADRIMYAFVTTPVDSPEYEDRKADVARTMKRKRT